MEKKIRERIYKGMSRFYFGLSNWFWNIGTHCESRMFWFFSNLSEKFTKKGWTAWEKAQVETISFEVIN